MLKLQILILLSVFIVLPSAAIDIPSTEDEKLEIGNYIIKVNNTRVRLDPNYSGKITNTLHKGTKVYVYEFKSGWARISKWYSGSVEGVVGDQMTGLVARWVPARLVVGTN